MILQVLAFYLFAVIVIASGVMVIAARNPVHSVLFLILAFFNAAGLFVLMGAEFLAFILIIVYVGAVAVLFLFVVMMLDINFVELRQGFLQYLPVGALVGVILLIGIVKKNAILMIDFALQKQRLGRSPAQAIYLSAQQRLRPILMTTAAAMLGAIPLALAYGVGAELRQPLGLAVLGGLVLSQLLTLFTTPIVFVGLEALRGRWQAWRSAKSVVLTSVVSAGRVV